MPVAPAAAGPLNTVRSLPSDKFVDLSKDVIRRNQLCGLGTNRRGGGGGGAMLLQET